MNIYFSLRVIRITSRSVTVYHQRSVYVNSSVIDVDGLWTLSMLVIYNAHSEAR